MHDCPEVVVQSVEPNDVFSDDDPYDRNNQKNFDKVFHDQENK
jgi:hypothetical protein